MLPIASLCLILLLFASKFYGEPTGHIHTHFGKCVTASTIQDINAIEVSTFSRLKSFAQCASHFRSQHLVIFDGKIERAYDPRRQQQYEKYRLKCAPLLARVVTDNNKRNPSEGTPQGPSEKNAEVFVRSRYEVFTQTGDKDGGGTSSTVYLELTGEAGSHQLFLKNAGQRMYSGKNNTFKFSSPCDIGKITRMCLSLPSFLTIDQWFCSQVEIQRELEYTHHTEVEIYHSNVDRWLPSMSINNIVGGSSDDIAYTRLKTYSKDF